MADQRPWWKLWVSALGDDDLESLTLENWARWARLGAHLKLHGEGGAMTCRRPGRALAKLWRTPRWESMLALARTLPGVFIEVVSTDPDGAPNTVRIGMKNWKKYQEDNSAERTRNYRNRKRRGDGVAPSQSDGNNRHTVPSGDGAQPSRCDDVEVEVEIDTPNPRLSPSQRQAAIAAYLQRSGTLHPDDQAKLQRASLTWPLNAQPPTLAQIWYRDGRWQRTEA